MVNRHRISRILLLDFNQPNQVEYEVISPENIDRLELTNSWGMGNFQHVSISPDESMIGVATSSGVYLYDSLTQKQIKQFGKPITSSAEWYSFRKDVAFDPDGIHVAIASEDIQIWNLQEDKLEFSLKNHVNNTKILQAVYSPDGKQLLAISETKNSACGNPSVNYGLYDLESKTLIYQKDFCSLLSLGYYYLFTNDKMLFLVGQQPRLDDNIEIDIVNTETGEMIKQINTENRVLSISPDGKTIAFYSMANQAIELFSPETESTLGVIENQIIFISSDIIPIMEKIGENWEVRNRQNQTVCTIVGSSELNLTDYYIHKPEIFNGHLFPRYLSSGTIEIMDINKCEIFTQILLPKNLRDAEFTYDGKYIYAEGNDHITSLWNAQTGVFYHSSDERRFSIESGKTRGPTLATIYKPPNGTYIIDIWDIPSWTIIREIDTKHTNPGFFSWRSHLSTFISQDGSLVATKDEKGLHFWDVKSGNLNNTLSNPPYEIYIRPDGFLYTYNQIGVIEFLSTKSNGIVKRLKVNAGYDLTFSQDWQFMIAQKRVVYEFWDVNNQQLVNVFYKDPENTSDPSQVDFSYLSRTAYLSENCFSLNPKTDLLVESGSYEINDSLSRKLLFWNPRDGSVVLDQALPSPSYIWDIAFSPDGTMLVTLSDGIFHIWRVRK